MQDVLSSHLQLQPTLVFSSLGHHRPGRSYILVGERHRGAALLVVLGVSATLVHALALAGSLGSALVSDTDQVEITVKLDDSADFSGYRTFGVVESGPPLSANAAPRTGGGSQANDARRLDQGEQAIRDTILAALEATERVRAAAVVRDGYLRGRGHVAELTPTDQVLTIMKRFKKGISVESLRGKSGFTEKQISNIVHRACKKGKMKRIGRGVYSVYGL